jgi:short-subunit dehydrogenase
MAAWFQQKSVFITGASSGIGAAVALEFAREGARVALAARRLDKLQDLKQEIEAMGGEALAVACDVTDRNSIDEAVAEVLAGFGGIDLVLANAGFGVGGAVQNLETEDFRRQFETNFFGVLDTVYAALPSIIHSKGQVGIVSSVLGRIATPTQGPYCASKFALVGLAECMYYDLAEVGVSVSCINPGIVASEFRSKDNFGEDTGKDDYAPGWIVVPTEKAAKDIVRALYKRKPEAVITGHGKVIVFLNRHFPWLARWLVRVTSKSRHARIDHLKEGGNRGGD